MACRRFWSAAFLDRWRTFLLFAITRPMTKAIRATGMAKQSRAHAPLPEPWVESTIPPDGATEVPSDFAFSDAPLTCSARLITAGVRLFFVACLAAWLLSSWRSVEDSRGLYAETPLRVRTIRIPWSPSFSCLSETYFANSALFSFPFLIHLEPSPGTANNLKSYGLDFSASSLT